MGSDTRRNRNRALARMGASALVLAACAGGALAAPGTSQEPSGAAPAAESTESPKPTAETSKPATPSDSTRPAHSGPSAPKARPAAWLGISFQDVAAADLPAGFKHPSPEGAVRILQVFNGTSAYQAGLQEDDFILSINGVPLAGRKTLLDTIRSKGVGDVVELRIGRGGKSLTQKMALSPKPEDMRSITRTLVGATAPELEGKYYSGDLGPLAKNRGKVLVLDFWATWCGPCRATIPALDSLQRKYRARGVEVIGISSESLPELKAFQAANRQGYTLFNDIGQVTTRRYQAFAYPTLVLVDRKGVVQRVEVGAHKGEVMEKWIRELL